MKFNQVGRLSLALVFSLSLLLGITACGSGTIGYMYVTGAQYNQIAGYKIDDLSGNLTPIVQSPFSSGGTDPICSVILNGGRYLYVLNHGTGSAGSSSITLFSIGGDGVLANQATYNTLGNNPVWMVATGSFLYVLDQQESTTAYTGANTALGDLTAFSVNSSTGRLTLLPNGQSTSSGNTLIPYFPVGQSPVTMRMTPGGTYIYVLDHGPVGSASSEYFTVYAINATNGQLTLPSATNTEFAAAGNTGDTISAIAVEPAGRYFYQYDSTQSTIYPFTIGSSGNLQSINAGAYTVTDGGEKADWIMADAHTKFLYIMNTAANPANTTAPASSISAFTIDSTTGRLSELTDSPYSTGSDPICGVEDPTNQYLYTANFNDGTVIGKLLNQNTGQLSPLNRATSFTVNGSSTWEPTCLVVSGITS
jgi:6-phosphogluconolactonase (cycloisomerase 2 family)